MQFAAVSQIREGRQDRGQGREGRDDRADFRPREPGMFDVLFHGMPCSWQMFFRMHFHGILVRANQDRSEGVDYWDRANMGKVSEY